MIKKILTQKLCMCFLIMFIVTLLTLHVSEANAQIDNLLKGAQNELKKHLEESQKEVDKFTKNPQKQLDKNLKLAESSLNGLDLKGLSNELVKEFKKSGKVDSQKSFKIKKQILRTLLSEYAQEDKISKSKARLGLIDEATIVSLKKLPIYDVEKNKPVKLENWSKEQIQKIPELRGSEIADNPLETTAVIICDPEYLLYADFIKTKDGKWISIDDASNLGYKKNEIKELKSLLKALSLAKDIKDPTKIDKNMKRIEDLNKNMKRIEDLNKNMKRIVFLIDKINKEKETLNMKN